MYAFGFQRKTHPAISVCVEAFFLLLADRGRQFRILFRLSYPADKIIRTRFVIHQKMRHIVDTEYSDR